MIHRKRPARHLTPQIPKRSHQVFTYRHVPKMRSCATLAVILCCCLKIHKASEAAAGVSIKNGTDDVATPIPAVLSTTLLPDVLSTAPAVVPTTTRRPLIDATRIPCSCSDGQCGCCTGVILERFRQKACMNLTYEPDDFSITGALSMNGRVLYTNTVSGKNPPPMCVRVPRFRFIRFCVEFSNIYLAQRNIHMCIDAEAEWEEFTLLEWSFDCIRMGASGVAVVRPEDGGGLPLPGIDEEDQVDEDYDDSARNVPLVNNSTLVSKVIKGRKVNVKRLNNGDVSISFGGGV